MSDFNIPDEDEVRASGAGAWVDEAIKHHSKKQEKLARTFSKDKDAVRQEKDKLAAIWSTPPEEEEKDRGPDLFAKERESGHQKKQSLAALFGDDLAEREKEQDALRNLFGGGSGGGGKKKKR